MTTATTQVTITPKMLAEAFWSMGSEDQVAFFKELASVIKEDHKTNSSAYSLGELQWFFVAGELDNHKEAKDMLMTMAAPLYLNTLRYSEGRAV